MCHSVEMYLPQMAQRAAEHRIGQADFTAAERERLAVGVGLGLIGRIARFARYVTGSRVFTRENVFKLLKYNDNRDEHDSWLADRKSSGRQDAAGTIGERRAGQVGAELIALGVRT